MKPFKHLLLQILLVFPAILYGQTNTFPPSGDVGIGTLSPTAKLHVVKENSGINSVHAAFVMEAIDAQLDLTSSSDGSWGSTINLIEGNGSSNTDVWSLARMTTGGAGDSSLRINFGTANIHNNPSVMAIKSNGNVGIGTTNPTGLLEVRSGNNNGIRFNYGNTSSISFLPNDGDSQFHISHTLDNRLTISQGASVAQVKLLTIKNTGEMGIGTTTPDAKLAVKGSIHAEEVKVDLNVPAPDYVFKDGYDLKSLQEIQDYIKEHGHLPNVPSAQEMEEDGIELGGMNMKLLEKIEELTLYTLDQENELKTLKEDVKKLKNIIKKLVPHESH
ncbi:hypothetical protein FGF1_14860 [Flavobacteriaceae bacterium GF1]